MDRRSFLKSSAMVPFLIHFSCKQSKRPFIEFREADDKQFAFLEVHGTYREIGYQTGRVFKKNLHAIIKRRKSWHDGLLDVLNTKEGRMRSDELIRLTQKQFPHILEEAEGIAEGAGIGFDSYWAMSIKSELSCLEVNPPGCSTIYFQDHNRKWLFHNEDGHAACKDIMFVIKAVPPSGVGYLAMVYPGILFGKAPAMNSRGIIETTNFIGGTRSEIGLPRYVISRAILEAEDMNEAVQIATMEPRAYPFHHNLASVSDGSCFSVETVPGIAEIKKPNGIYVHTNHLLFNRTREYPYQDAVYQESSSMTRYRIIREKIQSVDPETVESDDFMSILASHEGAPYSPCRHPKDAIQGQTLGTGFFDISEGLFRLYKGNPCEALKNNRHVDFVL